MKYYVYFKVCETHESWLELNDEQLESDWHFAGETWAVSEKQAINNIRHRVFGDYNSSQYKYDYVCGDGAMWKEWKAVKKQNSYYNN